MIRTGQLVYTSDGAMLGSVAEVDGAYVKISAPMALDYLLPVACIHDTTEEALRTTFVHADLEQFRREPGSV